MSAVNAPATPPSARASVMLVDDEAHILRALQRELRREPLSLAAFTSPQAARDAFAADRFDVVVADNMMPGLSGLELLAWLKEHHGETRRILLTGQTELSDAVRAFNDGTIHRFLTKPWDPQELLEAINEQAAIHAEREKERRVRHQLAGAVRQRGSRLDATLQELKEAKTQLFLYEDSPTLARVRLSSRVRGLSVVVVDEHPGVRELLVSTLKRLGVAKVEGAESSAQALELIASTPLVDLVLSELRLTDMDGLALYHAVRELSGPSAKAVFMLLTVREQREAVEQALEAGVDGYVLKPFHVADLLARVEDLVQRRHRDSLEQRLVELRPLSIIAANIDLDTRIEIQHLLASAGVQNVAIADSGQKALRWIREKRPDVVVYDCNVRDPYWTDLDDALEPTGMLMPPLVVTSVAPVPKEYEEAYARGLTTFLPGQITRRELLQSILRALDSRPAAAE